MPDYHDHLSQHFDRLFGRVLPDIPQPDPLAHTEAAEGIAALTTEDTGNDD